jgi:hypothetical protein
MSCLIRASTSTTWWDCARAEQFSTVTGKILTALGHWCRAVEADLGPMPVTAVSPITRDILAQLSAEPATSGA